MSTQKIAIVTGGSRGIGAATSVMLAASGFDVCLSYRKDKSAGQAVAALIQARGQKAVLVEADVANETDVLNLFTTCREVLGTPTALVNNAGIVADQARIDEIDLGKL